MGAVGVAGFEVVGLEVVGWGLLVAIPPEDDAGVTGAEGS